MAQVKREELYEDEMATDEDDLSTKHAITSLITTDYYDSSQLPDLLRIYYTWIFPYDKYFDWLQYGKKTWPVDYRPSGKRYTVRFST